MMASNNKLLADCCLILCQHLEEERICPRLVSSGKLVNVVGRISDHKTYIRTKKLNQPTGEHFNRPGHTLDNLKVTVLERIRINNTIYRKEREAYLIRKFNTYNKGMNKSP